MPRMARLVVPGYPHHVTQRGNRKQQTFFSDGDYKAYLALLREQCRRSGTNVWAYCLMPNHVHLVIVPTDPNGLASLLRVTHHRYVVRINTRHGWQGHLWQERFYSTVMDEAHLLAAVRYVELNPVRAGICSRPEMWPWSSIHVHLRGGRDPVVDAAPMRERVGDWGAYLATSRPGPTDDELRSLTRRGRPAGNPEFVTKLERLTGRRLRELKRGPRPAS